jgi:acylphosphatase
MERRHILVSGRVQGVFFRASTRDVAREAGCTGWVRNLDDGRVEAEVQGPAEAVDRVVAHCRSGPSQARVESVEVRTLPVVDDERRFEAV